MTLEQRLQDAGRARVQATKDQQTAKRLLHKTVREADRRKWPKTRIAAVAGVSRQTVHDILKSE